MRTSLLLLALLVSGTAAATGPSHARVRLRPVAARAGHVLFSTRWTSNPEGAYRNMRIDYGWLVASAAGVWEEVPHASIVPDAEAEVDEQEVERLYREFLVGVDWGAPPESLKPLLRKYGFTEKDVVHPAEGMGTVVWTPELLCRGKRCVQPCEQRSLRNLRADAGDGWPVAAAFVHSGLALFQNASGYDEPLEEASERNRGASFSPERELEEWGHYGIDMQSVSGLCVLPRALRAPVGK
jgi:hypothetical protein